MFTRRLDWKGRINIPSEVRKKLGFEKYQEVEIILERDCISIKAFGDTSVYRRTNKCIIKSLDESDRVVIPLKYSKALNIQRDTDFTMELQGETIKLYPKELAPCT